MFNKSKKIDKIVRKYRMAGNGNRDEYIDRKVRVRIGLEFRINVRDLKRFLVSVIWVQLELPKKEDDGQKRKMVRN